MAYYRLGNCLRGYYTGDFDTDEDAWDALSAKFNIAYPSRGGRDIEMWKVVRSGLTEGGNETERDREFREKIEATFQP